MTDDKGRFELGPVAPGVYYIEPKEFSIEQDGNRSERRPLPAVFLPQPMTLLSQQQAELIEVRGVPAVRVTVRCVDSAGRPDLTPGHVTMSLPANAGNTLLPQPASAESGTLTFLAPRDLGGLVLYAGMRSVHRWERGGRVGPAMAPLRLDALTSDVSDIRLVRYATPELRIQVRDPDGASIPEAKIDVRCDSYGIRRLPIETRPGGEGGRCLLLPPDEPIAVSVMAPGFRPHSETLRLKEDASRDLEIVLRRR